MRWLKKNQIHGSMDISSHRWYSYYDNWNSRVPKQMTNKMKMKISKEQPDDEDAEEKM